MRAWTSIVMAGVPAAATALLTTFALADRPDRPPSPPPAPPPSTTCPTGYVRVPAGSFWMGSPDGEGSGDEHPQTRMTVTAFCMQKTEVTVTAYAACVTAGGCPPAPTTVHLANLSDASRARFSAFCNGGKTDRGDHPINCVDASQSAAFCKWSGARLPTEVEWEYAARGADGRPFPWGRDAPASQLCWRRATGDMSAWQGTCPVGSFANGGDTPLGLHDMAGNVWEWTSSPHCPYGPEATSCQDAVLAGRGGGWHEADAALVRGATRNRYGSAIRDTDLGFRCAR